LKKYWGYDDFRPLQLDIIQSAMDGIDTLALMPTGGGKSLCFQVPALCQEGVCLVISPLIALMKDQVYQLQKRNIPAQAIYSGMHYREIDRVLDNAVYGGVKLLYMSPERLTSDLALERIKRMNINLVAVDEAHCISQWGYDFRPSYLEIAAIREWIPNVPILALTATATSEVVIDIQEKLTFKKGKVFQKSFERSNLAYVVLDEERKYEKLLDILRKVGGSAVVYSRNRKGTKDIANYLIKNGISADYYNAGLNTLQRSHKQDAWIQNKIRVMVATNAFGMGIDKPDVRVVVHMDLPDSLEAYFQEAGRAGRDGKKAFPILLYNESDGKTLQRHYKNAFPPFKEIKRVYRALGSYFQLAVGAGMGDSFDFEILVFTKNFGLEVVRTYSTLKILEQAGWIILSDAIFVPSSVRVIVGKDMLYDYQLRNKSMEKILKAILRTTHGAFNNFVNIDENQLSRFLKLSRVDFVRSLNKLQSDGILDYRPQKDAPQIIFLKERVSADNLTIDFERYEFLKKRYLLRIQEAIKYAEQNQCRSQQLLQYFGEENGNICGVCDICLGRKKEITSDAYEKYKGKIKGLLRREKLTLKELLDSFSERHKKQVQVTIEYLIDEGFLDKEEDRYFWK